MILKSNSYEILCIIYDQKGEKKKKNSQDTKERKGTIEFKREIGIKRTKRRKGAKEQNGKEKYGKGNKRNNSA